MTTFTATYSPEDNKLRLYASSRLDSETYQMLKNAGFKWAPKQELFVAPSWSPDREDILIDLAGEIEPEEMTLAERAEAKAARIDEAIDKKRLESDSYYRAASSISERFAFGQPILVGHHSERKARKDSERMGRAMNNASAAMEKVRYLSWKAEGVERHANRKNRSDVRARRIKTLLAELRDLQRGINHGFIVKDLWEKIATKEPAEKIKAVEYFAGAHLKTGSASYWEAYDDVKNGKPHDEVIEKSLKYAEGYFGPKRYRWIEHTLNRLSYERGELGSTKRYDGNLREVIIQSFAREQGAHKPESQKTDSGFILRSSVPLPLHIADGKEIEMNEDQWRDLMQSTGYEVPEKTATGKTDIPQLLNLNVLSVTVKAYNKIMELPVFHVTKEEHGKIYKDYKWTRFSSCGKFRIRTGYKPGESWRGGEVAYFITDSKAHNIPDSPAIKKKDEAA